MERERIEKKFPAPWEKYAGISALSVKEIFYYPKKLHATVFMVPFRIAVMVLIYTYAFNYAGRAINGIDAKIAIWSIAVYHLLLFAQFRGIFKTINEEVKSGQLELQLNKPYHYVFYKFFEHFGRGLISFAVAFIMVVPLLWIILEGFPADFSLARLFGGAALAATGTLVSSAVYVLIALPALWIDDAQPLFWIVDKAILILGGAYIPIALLPSSLQTLAALTPFGAPMFATQMFNPDFLSRWPQFFAAQILWMGVLSAAIYFVFSRARKKLSINGG